MSGLNDRLSNLSLSINSVNSKTNNRVIEIEVSKIKGHEDNQKIYDLNELNYLKEWIIEAGGILQPLILIKNQDNYKILAGHKRLACAIELNMETVPAIILEDNDNADDQLIKLIATNQQRNQSKEERKNEIETMRVVLKNKGVKNVNERIAELFNVSERTIYRQVADDNVDADDQLEKVNKQKDDSNDKLEKKIQKLVDDVIKNAAKFDISQKHQIQQALFHKKD